MSAPLQAESLRMSEALGDLIRRQGRFSTAARALILLGAHSLGLPLDQVEDELVALLAARDLTPQLRRRLLELYDGRMTGVGQASDAAGAVPDLPQAAVLDAGPPADPWAVGFEV